MGRISHETTSRWLTGLHADLWAKTAWNRCFRWGFFRLTYMHCAHSSHQPHAPCIWAAAVEENLFQSKVKMYTFWHSCGKVIYFVEKKSMCGHCFFKEEIANMRWTTRYNYWKGFLQFMHVNPFQSQVKWNKRNHPLGPFIWNRVTSPLVLRCLIYTSVKCKCWGTKANLEPLLNLGSNELFNFLRWARSLTSVQLLKTLIGQHADHRV